MNLTVIKEIHYNDLDAFLNAILYNGELYDLFSNYYIFRGESSDLFKLLPTALREEGEDLLWRLSGNKNNNERGAELLQIQKEYLILKKFYQIADNRGLHIPNIPGIRDFFYNLIDYNVTVKPGKWLSEDFFEIAGLAQHYGLPTRLLDWSQDIFVSLYFAVTGAIKAKEKGMHISDNIVLWALNASLATTIYDMTHNEDILKIAGFTKPEKDLFSLRIITPQYNGNPNLYAQQGVFTLWEIMKPIHYNVLGQLNTNINVKTDRTPLNILIENYFKQINKEKVFSDSLWDSRLLTKTEIPFLFRITLPVEYIYELYDFLKYIKYNASRLFPGYNGIAQSIQEDALCLQCVK